MQVGGLPDEAINLHTLRVFGDINYNRSLLETLACGKIVKYGSLGSRHEASIF